MKNTANRYNSPLDNTKSSVTDTMGRKCNCVGQYCINADGLACKLDPANKPTMKSSVFGLSDIPLTESAGSNKGPVPLGALAALSAVFYCLL